MTIFRHFKILITLCFCLCGLYIALQTGQRFLTAKEVQRRETDAVVGRRRQKATSQWTTNRLYRHPQERVTERFSLRNNTVVRERLTSETCIPLWRHCDRDSKWFSEKFNHSLRPVWTRENIDVKPQVFDWWLNLRSKNQSYESVINRAKELAKTSDLFLGNKPRDCITCAVVGNSGNLRNSGYGERIDGHEVIIRMNESPVVGFEKDVGIRTTHYIAYPESFKTSSLRNASFVLAPFCVRDIEWLQEQLKKNSGSNSSAGKFVLNENKVFVMNLELMWQIKHTWGLGKGRWASTGILGVFFALQMCDEVDVFGFGANAKGYWDHYFSKDDGEKNSAFQKTHVHDDEAERLLLKNLVEAKKITIYTGPR